VTKEGCEWLRVQEDGTRGGREDTERNRIERNGWLGVEGPELLACQLSVEAF